MIQTLLPELVVEVRRLLEAAGNDEQAAIAKFDSLLNAHGADKIGPAVAIVTAEYVKGRRNV